MRCEYKKSHQQSNNEKGLQLWTNLNVNSEMSVHQGNNSHTWGALFECPLITGFTVSPYCYQSRPSVRWGYMYFVWFSMWDGFFSKVSESHSTSGEKSISHGKPHKMHFLAYFTLQGTLIMLNILCKVEDHENQLLSIWGKVGSMREYLWLFFMEDLKAEFYTLDTLKV